MFGDFFGISYELYELKMFGFGVTSLKFVITQIFVVNDSSQYVFDMHFSFL